MTRRKAHTRRPSEGHRQPSQRQLRVGEAIRHDISALLERGVVRDPELAEASVTVTEVAMSPDLRVATVYVTPFGGGDGAALATALNRAAPALRRMLAPMVTLKFLPELRFVLDTSFDRARRIEALLERARTERPDDDGA